MSAPRGPLAPVVAGDDDLTEIERLVLDALRKRALQFRSGLPGLASAAVTRVELCRRARTTDRSVRDAVEGLREKAWPVLFTSSSPGYWLSDDPEEIEACIEREYMGRIRHHARSSRGLRRAAAYLRARQQEGASPPVQGGLL